MAEKAEGAIVEQRFGAALGSGALKSGKVGW
jgi:hypothetical protein